MYLKLQFMLQHEPRTWWMINKMSASVLGEDIEFTQGNFIFASHYCLKNKNLNFFISVQTNRLVSYIFKYIPWSKYEKRI